MYKLVEVQRSQLRGATNELQGVDFKKGEQQCWDLAVRSSGWPDEECEHHLRLAEWGTDLAA